MNRPRIVFQLSAGLQARIASAACLVVFAVTVCCCQAQTVRWKFERRVVDQQRSPITNATVEVSGHGRSLTSLNAQQDRVLHTDKKGMFAIDTRAQSLYVTITNAGFVRKQLYLDPAVVAPNGFPASGDIVLTRARKLPRPDHLDKIELATLEINNFKPGSSAWIRFRPGRVQTAPDAGALVRIERGTNGFRIICQPGTQGKALVYDAGLWEPTWRSSNAFVDEGGLTTEFLCPTRPQPSYGNDRAAFVLKTHGYWVLATLSALCGVGYEDFVVAYNLSRDNVFVNESRDTDAE